MGFFSRLFGGANAVTDEPEDEQLKRVLADPAIKFTGAKLLEGCDRLPNATGRFGLLALTSNRGILNLPVRTYPAVGPP